MLHQRLSIQERLASSPNSLDSLPSLPNRCTEQSSIVLAFSGSTALSSAWSPSTPHPCNLHHHHGSSPHAKTNDHGEMDSITVHTVKELKDHNELPRKRKYTSKACSSCRKLKIRCRELTTTSGAPSCEHCSKTQTECSWPDTDGRKCRRARSPSPCSLFSNATDLTVPVAQPNANTIAEPPPEERFNGSSVSIPANGIQGYGPASFSPVSQTPHTILQYYRYLGPTAIAPGYKKISLKIANDSNGSESQPVLRSDSSEQLGTSVFDPRTNLPRAELLPHLLDAFFEYYGSYFCFLYRRQLESLIKADEISTFLLCSIAALSARFCDPGVFAPYFPPLQGSEVRERWHYSLPFLSQAKTLLMPLLSIPSRDLVAGLLFLALAEFGDNNEAGKGGTSCLLVTMAE